MFKDTLKTVIGAVFIGGFLVWISISFVGGGVKKNPPTKTLPDIYFDEGLSIKGISSDNPQKEYLVLRISKEFNNPLTLSGLTLSSESDKKIPIGFGTKVFVSGKINTEEIITAMPGDTVVFVSGESPIGTSFRVSACSGYLSQFQDFEPKLSATCPNPNAILPQADLFCSDFVKTIPSCQTPINLDSKVSSSCKTVINQEFNYNSCVAENKNKPSFDKKEWRIYLGEEKQIWDKNEDTISLVDANDTVIASLEYSLGQNNSK